MRKILSDMRINLSNCLYCMRVTIGLARLFIELVKLARMANPGPRAGDSSDSGDSEFSARVDSLQV